MDPLTAAELIEAYARDQASTEESARELMAVARIFRTLVITDQPKTPTPATEDITERVIYVVCTSCARRIQ